MDNQPINEKEKAIKDQLILNGLNENEIEFRGEINYRYIRYGYWSRLNEAETKNIDLEEDPYEDNFGTERSPIIVQLYSYIIK
jgi:hypothetical protein